MASIWAGSRISSNMRRTPAVSPLLASMLMEIMRSRVMKSKFGVCPALVPIAPISNRLARPFPSRAKCRWLRSANSSVARAANSARVEPAKNRSLSRRRKIASASGAMRAGAAKRCTGLAGLSYSRLARGVVRASPAQSYTSWNNDRWMSRSVSKVNGARGRRSDSSDVRAVTNPFSARASASGFVMLSLLRSVPFGRRYGSSASGMGRP